MTQRERLTKLLVFEEGLKLTVYKDSLGYLTCGVGHRVTKEDGLYENDTISMDRVQSLFDKDLDRTIIECHRLFDNHWVDFPESIQDCLINMCYQMGRNGLSKFKKFINALYSKDYTKAASELVNSVWYKQTPNRATRIVKIIKAQGGKNV